MSRSVGVQLRKSAGRSPFFFSRAKGSPRERRPGLREHGEDGKANEQEFYFLFLLRLQENFGIASKEKSRRKDEEV